jgi:hypothetical protein
MTDLPVSKVVVCALGGNRGFLELPESTLGDRRLISGGERSLYELATALAVLGVDVELRGDLQAQLLDTITEAGRARPTVGLPPRRPEPGEVIVLPDGLRPDLFLATHLSGAHTVVLMLGPPGLCGWSFLAGWEPPDLLEVEVSRVGTVAMYQAMAALGFSLWTEARGIEEACRKAGVNVSQLGSGTPVPFPDPPPKTVDIAVIEENRWFPLARDVARQLSTASVVLVPTQTVYSLSEALGPARILPWPSRVEGRSRIAREARAVGTVPVSLDTNPFATARDHGRGTVLVPDLATLVRETDRLLHAPDELAELAAQGAQSAREEVDWERYLGRVSTALRELPTSPSADARSEFGREIAEQQRRLADALQQKELEHRRTLDALHQEELEHHRTRDALEQETADRAALTRELAATRRALASYRSRRVIRLLDDSAVGHVIRMALTTPRRLTGRR